MSRIVQFDTLGAPSELRIVEVDPPVPPVGKVRIAMRAAGLNPVDLKIVGGRFGDVSLPGKVGREVAGVIDALGGGVEGFAIGDEVFGNVAGVGVADLVITNPNNLARRPLELPWEVAGAISVAGQTAWDAFHSQEVSDADTVLVSAAAGGVGTVIAQLALLRGATVIGTASAANHDYLAKRGIIPVSYGDGLADRVRDAGAVTVVFDQHGAETIEAALELGVSPDRINTTAGNATAFGIQGVGRGPINTDTLDALAALIINGDIVVEIDAVYPLEQVVEAYERLATGHLRGKIVVVP